MFYVYGKFRTISMKIKEVITPLAILDYFLPGVLEIYSVTWLMRRKLIDSVSLAGYSTYFMLSYACFK
jgi:hypothetical protein